jgi:5-formyltetrahydrofolate cyclo-ligase
VQAPGESRLEKPEASRQGPTCLAQGTTDATHTAEAGVFPERQRTIAAALLFLERSVTDLDDRKAALRTRLKGQMPGDPEAASFAAQDRLLRSGLLPAAGVMALYRALPSEVSTNLLAGALLARGAVVCWPQVVQGRVLEFRQAGERWTHGALRVEEPDGEVVPLPLIEWLVIPAVAVDMRGHRLGRGKGYYDATLAAFAGRSVALVFDLRVVDEVPSGPDDRRVDALCTESRLVMVSG